MSLLRPSPTYLSQEEAGWIASRQLLSFLFVPYEDKVSPSLPAPGKSLFSLELFPTDAFRKAPELFEWKSRTIYDVDGLKLFHDHTVELDDDHEIRVRVAASDLLRTPVWSISAGTKCLNSALLQMTLNSIKDSNDLEPEILDNQEVKLVCYSYPKLGILCRSRRRGGERFIVELGASTVIPATRSIKSSYSFANSVWSPYDLVTNATSLHFKRLWRRNLAALPVWSTTFRDLHTAISIARENVTEDYTTPKLILEGQQTDWYCAAASARMILRQHGPQFDLLQDDIASAMGTTPAGASLADQATAIETLTGSLLRGEVEPPPAYFEEIQGEIDQDRPFMIASTAEHVRACGGYMADDGQQKLLIYDPWPPNQGCVYFEDWQAGYHSDFLYIRPPSLL